MLIELFLLHIVVATQTKSSALCCLDAASCSEHGGCGLQCRLAVQSAVSGKIKTIYAQRCARFRWMCPNCYSAPLINPDQARCCLFTSACAADDSRAGCRRWCGFAARANATYAPRCYGHRHLCPQCFNNALSIPGVVQRPRKPAVRQANVAVEQQESAPAMASISGPTLRPLVMQLAFFGQVVLQSPTAVLLAFYLHQTARWYDNRYMLTSRWHELQDPLDDLCAVIIGIIWGAVYSYPHGTLSPFFPVYVSSRPISYASWACRPSAVWLGLLLLLGVSNLFAASSTPTDTPNITPLAARGTADSHSVQQKGLLLANTSLFAIGSTLQLCLRGPSRRAQGRHFKHSPFWSGVTIAVVGLALTCFVPGGCKQWQGLSLSSAPLWCVIVVTCALQFYINSG